MKHVWIQLLSTLLLTFSYFFRMWFDFPLFFFHSQKFPFFFTSVHFSLHPSCPAQSWLIIKAIFLHPGWITAVGYLTKYLSYNCHHLLHLWIFYCRRKKSYDLHDIKIERSKFRLLSRVHPKYRSDELRPKIIISVVKYALANLFTGVAVR